MTPDDMGFFKRLKWRVIWSCAGLRDTWASEHSFRSWVWANVVSGGLAVWLLDGAELALILALGVLVLAMELMNTALEKAVDLVSLEQSELARMAKDAGSAAVMVSAIAVGVAWFVALLS
jgi:diacylglycerol kinase (ATP)